VHNLQTSYIQKQRRGGRRERTRIGKRDGKPESCGLKGSVEEGVEEGEGNK
jgi:hypothetical protein